MRLQTFYHWTAPATSHLGSILATGEIQTTESNVSLTRPHAGPSVVWLTSSATLEGATWMNGMDLKRGAQLQVELRHGDASPWSDWACSQGISARDRIALAESGGDPETWWILPRPIRRWSIVHLGIRTTRVGDDLIPGGDYEGAELRRLFMSAGARRSLCLLKSKRV